jgi:Protein of unknown function (DUF1573)
MRVGRRIDRFLQTTLLMGISGRRFFAGAFPQRRMFVVILPTLGVFGLLAAVGWPSQPGNNKAHATIFSSPPEDRESAVHVVRPVVDVGTIDQSAKVRVYFELRNDRTKAVKIESIQTSCGCTTASPQNTIIPAGDSLQIPVTLDPAGLLNGRFSKTIICRLVGSASSRIIPLYLTGNVEKDHLLSVFPGVLDFGQMRFGEVKEKTVYVRGAASMLDRLPFRIELSGSDQVLIFSEPSTSSLDVKQKSLMVSFSPNLKSHGQEVHATLALKFDGATHSDTQIQYIVKVER